MRPPASQAASLVLASRRRRAVGRKPPVGRCICMLPAVSLAALAVVAWSGAEELRNNGKPEAGWLDDAIARIPGLGGA